MLITGGLGVGGVPLASAELYDPTSATFSATGRLGNGRYEHTASLLPHGKVLITGGYSVVMPSGAIILTSAELYDPASGTFSATGSLGTARQFHTATLLRNGKVLIAGGKPEKGTGGVVLASAELYDPRSATFSPTASLGTARHGHTATLLPNGKVLIAGGYSGSAYLNSVELYDAGPAVPKRRAVRH